MQTSMTMQNSQIEKLQPMLTWKQNLISFLKRFKYTILHNFSDTSLFSKDVNSSNSEINLESLTNQSNSIKRKRNGQVPGESDEVSGGKRQVVSFSHKSF